jgi:hypothetical protein
MLTVGSSKRLPRSEAVCWLVTEVSFGRDRGIFPGEDIRACVRAVRLRRHCSIGEARRSGTGQGKGLARQ